MKFSTKGRYALRIMADLAAHEGSDPVRLRDISERQDITLKYLEQIMPLLTKAGYVRSTRGNNGGYALTRKPKEYTVGEILRTAEGSLAPVPCIEDEPNRCPRCDRCVTLPLWKGLWKIINDYTDSITLADLLNQTERNPLL